MSTTSNRVGEGFHHGARAGVGQWFREAGTLHAGWKHDQREIAIEGVLSKGLGWFDRPLEHLRQAPLVPRLPVEHAREVLRIGIGVDREHAESRLCERDRHVRDGDRLAVFA